LNNKQTKKKKKKKPSISSAFLLDILVLFQAFSSFVQTSDLNSKWAF